MNDCVDVLYVWTDAKWKGSEGKRARRRNEQMSCASVRRVRWRYNGEKNKYTLIIRIFICYIISLEYRKNLKAEHSRDWDRKRESFINGAQMMRLSVSLNTHKVGSNVKGKVASRAGTMAEESIYQKLLYLCKVCNWYDYWVAWCKHRTTDLIQSAVCSFSSGVFEIAQIKNQRRKYCIIGKHLVDLRSRIVVLVSEKWREKILFSQALYAS